MTDLIPAIEARINHVAFSSCNEICAMTKCGQLSSDSAIYSVHRVGTLTAYIGTDFAPSLTHRAIVVDDAGRREVSFRHACAMLRNAKLAACQAALDEIRRSSPASLAA